MATITAPTPALPRAASGALHLWHLTSLDAVTVAVSWTLAFAWALGLRLPWWPPAVVGLSAWSFYIADRLFDAYRARTPLRLRHFFHWQHRRVFIPLTIACAAAALALVLWKMPLSTRIRDSVVAAAAVAYFAGVHRPELNPAKSKDRPRLLPKELLVAIVFTAACAAPALTRSAGRAHLLPPLLFFTALAWLNCHAIESWEAKIAGSANLAARWLAAAALAAAVAAACLHAGRISALLLAAASSSALIALLDRHRDRLEPTTLRALADLVLLTPLVLLALP